MEPRQPRQDGQETGQEHEDRNPGRTRDLGKNIQDMTVRTDSQARTARTGLRGQNGQGGTAREEEPGKDSQVRTAITGLLIWNSQNTVGQLEQDSNNNQDMNLSIGNLLEINIRENFFLPVSNIKKL
jgi:hypothetical protein